MRKPCFLVRGPLCSVPMSSTPVAPLRFESQHAETDQVMGENYGEDEDEEDEDGVESGAGNGV